MINKLLLAVISATLFVTCAHADTMNIESDDWGRQITEALEPLRNGETQTSSFYVYGEQASSFGSQTRSERVVYVDSDVL